MVYICSSYIYIYSGEYIKKICTESVQQPMQVFDDGGSKLACLKIHMKIRQSFSNFNGGFSAAAATKAAFFCRSLVEENGRCGLITIISSASQNKTACTRDRRASRYVAWQDHCEDVRRWRDWHPSARERARQGRNDAVRGSTTHTQRITTSHTHRARERERESGFVACARARC